MTKRLAAELEGIRVEVPSNIPVMLIREIDETRRVIPIYIGEAEASSISDSEYSNVDIGSQLCTVATNSASDYSRCSITMHST